MGFHVKYATEFCLFFAVDPSRTVNYPRMMFRQVMLLAQSDSRPQMRLMTHHQVLLKRRRLYWVQPGKPTCGWVLWLFYDVVIAANTSSVDEMMNTTLRIGCNCWCDQAQDRLKRIKLLRSGEFYFQLALSSQTLRSIPVVGTLTLNQS